MAASSEVLLQCDSEIKLAISTLKALITPPEPGIKMSDFYSSIQNNIKNATDVCRVENITKWTALFQEHGDIGDDYDPNWKHVCMSLGCLLHLQTITTSVENALFSVSDKGTVRSALQFISALGLLPLLQPGVGIALECRSRSLETFKSASQEALPPSLWQKRLSMLTKAFVKLLADKNWDLHGVILSSSLRDIIPALIQLSWSTAINTAEFETDVNEFQTITSDFFQSLHQPTIIRELLVCMRSRQQPVPPIWFIRACSKYLTRCLLSPRGAISTVRALHDLGGAEDDKNKEYATSAKLLAGPHGPSQRNYYLHLCPQLLELLYSGHIEYQNVAVHTIQLLWTKHKDLCQQQILEHLFMPIKTMELGDLEGNLVLESKLEEQLSVSITALLALLSPAGLPVNAISPWLENLCNLHLAVRHKGGTPQLRSKVRDLLSLVIANLEYDDTWTSIFHLSEDCLLDLASSSSTSNALFINLLNALNKTQDLEEKVLYCKLLMSVAEIPSVQRESLQKPNSILINTIKSFIEDPDSEMVSIALLLLGTMIAECEEWSQYQCLVPALQKLRQSTSLTESLRAVAEEIISTVATFGSFSQEKPSEAMMREKELLHQQSMSTSSTTKERPAKKTLSNFTVETSLEEIKDAEIPVQGHGYLSLTKLIKSKDPKVLASQDEIFDLSITGAKHEDSYVYLAAVGALSALVLISLENQLPKITANYNNTEHGVTLRTRLGESLLQVCKGLGEMAGKYRPILLNTFLIGAKDTSPAIRASSLSNLGEACRVLGFQVSSQLQEILLCAHSLAATDPELEVRRAATLLVSLLLRGLGKEAVGVLGSSALDLYRSMKQLAISEDPTLSLQAQLALEELSHGIKEGLFTPQPLEKKIYIMSPPP
ncbi:hypothetical protein B566_EDAN015862 [Ephemera danica]|nr:hypothetical protein B566_EDAN015862 [Ephemera danica]